MGYDFTGEGVVSIFLLIFAWTLQQCSANALFDDDDDYYYYYFVNWTDNLDHISCFSQ